MGKEAKYMAEQAEEDGMDHNAILLCKTMRKLIEILKKNYKPEDVGIVEGFQ